MRRKRSPFSGILAQPIKSVLPIEDRPDKPPRLCLALGLNAGQWPTFLEALRDRDREILNDKRRALFAHFGINAKHPTAEIDLILSLAHRHEREALILGERVSIAALYDLFKANDLRGLSWHLANKHVPGFRNAEPERWHGRLSSVEWADIFLAYIGVAEHLVRTSGEASDHQIVKILLNKNELAQIIPDWWARRIQTILERSGNKDRDSQRDLSSRSSFLRTAFGEARQAWFAFKSGEPSDFQLQIIVEVEPLVRRKLDRMLLPFDEKNGR